MIEPTLNITINQINSTSEWVELLRIVLPLIAVLIASWLPISMRVKHHRQEIRIQREFDVLDELLAFLGGYLLDFEIYHNQFYRIGRPTALGTYDAKAIPISTIEDRLIDKEIKFGMLKYKVYGYLKDQKFKNQLQGYLDKLANMFVKCRVITSEALATSFKVDIVSKLSNSMEREKSIKQLRKDLEKSISESKNLLDDIISMINKIKK